MSEILEQVSDTYRSDGHTKLIASMDTGYVLNIPDGLQIEFDDVEDYYIEEGMEWAILSVGGTPVVSLNNTKEVDYPRWLFVELMNLYENGSLLPVEQYETRFTLNER
ncbi:hypothetical protein HRTV-17_gp113 [Halorubrum phage HRTV-17]|uniref:Uncharacterized protein n=1 Tax=Halorubrum phage HRTV-17 TaxID=2877997 RepID=A0AAE8XSU4_9CAUD|nr:hypothetical protein HRTV-17_gp113 [Halorubrum phage HRTV-17]